MSTIEDHQSDFERQITVSATRPINFAELFIVLNGSVPLLMLAYDARNFRLGANPIDNALHTTGMLSLLFLVATLLITPLLKWTKVKSLFYFRRPLGLYAFFYAVMHVMVYVAYDRSLILSDAWSEFLQRRYLQIGAAGLLLMVPLAITSTPSMVSYLGFERWKWLHRLIYLSAIASVIHYYMQVKIDTKLPIAMGAVVGGLLLIRAVTFVISKRNKRVEHLRIETSRSTDSSYKICFVDTQQDVMVGPNVTILEAAESIGVELPFECRAGICGTCRIQVLDGFVEMETIDGLSNEERQHSYILACQAKCRSDVRLRL